MSMHVAETSPIFRSRLVPSTTTPGLGSHPAYLLTSMAPRARSHLQWSVAVHRGECFEFKVDVRLAADVDDDVVDSAAAELKRR